MKNNVNLKDNKELFDKYDFKLTNFSYLTTNQTKKKNLYCYDQKSKV